MMIPSLPPADKLELEFQDVCSSRDSEATPSSGCARSFRRRNSNRDVGLGDGSNHHRVRCVWPELVPIVAASDHDGRSLRPTRACGGVSDSPSRDERPTWVGVGGERKGVAVVLRLRLRTHIRVLLFFKSSPRHPRPTTTHLAEHCYHYLHGPVDGSTSQGLCALSTLACIRLLKSIVRTNSSLADWPRGLRRPILILI
eukprot:2996699-Rhodomonas_salina.1